MARNDVLVICGKGNNGGDGLAAARHLWNQGFSVEIILFADPEDLKEDPKLNFEIVSRMKIPLVAGPNLAALEKSLAKAGVVIDALFGVGLHSPVAEPYLSAVLAVNAAGKKVIAVDIPSGLHSDTGEVMGAAVRAEITGTLGLPKRGLYAGEGPQYAGEIRVIDIGIPLRGLAP